MAFIGFCGVIREGVCQAAPVQKGQELQLLCRGGQDRGVAGTRCVGSPRARGCDGKARLGR